MRNHSGAACLAVLIVVGMLSFSNPAMAEIVNILSIQEGTAPIVSTPSNSGWEAEAMIDGSLETGWACESGGVTDNIFLFELAEPAAIERLEFDNVSVDAEGAAARDIVVEVSADTAQSGYLTILETTLADRTAGQVFPVSTPGPVQWVRLTICNNYGNEEYTELFDFKAYGPRPPLPAPSNVTGTYETDRGLFHVLQHGASVSGCYENNEGLLDGAIEGRVMKMTWHEGQVGGLAIVVFDRSGKSFRGYWWYEDHAAGMPEGIWTGIKMGGDVGSCPHWD